MAQLSGGEKRAFYLTALGQHQQLLKAAIEQMAQGNLVHALTIATQFASSSTKQAAASHC
jgi:acid stress-induced BolA-like protein IbaG/YrbA